MRFVDSAMSFSDELVGGNQTVHFALLGDDPTHKVRRLINDGRLLFVRAVFRGAVQQHGRVLEFRFDEGFLTIKRVGSVRLDDPLDGTEMNTNIHGIFSFWASEPYLDYSERRLPVSWRGKCAL